MDTASRASSTALGARAHNVGACDSLSAARMSARTRQHSPPERGGDGGAGAGDRDADAEHTSEPQAGALNADDEPSAAAQQRAGGGSSTHEARVLKQFDLDNSYGPSSGVRRSARLRRAARLGINVGAQIRQAVQQEDDARARATQNGRAGDSARKESEAALSLDAQGCTIST